MTCVCANKGNDWEESWVTVLELGGVQSECFPNNVLTYNPWLNVIVWCINTNKVPAQLSGSGVQEPSPSWSFSLLLQLQFRIVKHWSSNLLKSTNLQLSCWLTVSNSYLYRPDPRLFNYSNYCCQLLTRQLFFHVHQTNKKGETLYYRKSASIFSVSKRCNMHH